MRTNRWTTLWREDGVKLWEETGKASSYIVEFPIQKKPEEIWKDN